MKFDDSAQVRRHIVQALRADLMGPFDLLGESEAEEVWDMAPSKRYLTGFLVPTALPQNADDEDEDNDPSEAVSLEVGDDPPNDPHNDPQAKPRPLLPSSIGLSVLLPKAATGNVRICVAYADYVPEPQPIPVNKSGRPKRGRPAIHWRRSARAPIEVDLPLDESLHDPEGFALGDSGLRLHGYLKAAADVTGLSDGSRALSVFVVNDRLPPADKKLRDSAYVFQVSLEIRHPQGLEPRPDLAGQTANDPDDRIMDLQFRNELTYAAGHGVAVVPIEEDGRVVGARTEWLPEAAVKRVKTRSIDGVVTSMEELAELPDGAAARRALSGIVDQYSDWIKDEERRVGHLSGRRKEVVEHVLHLASRARDRILDGIEFLAANPTALQCFKIANRAMAMAARQRSSERYKDGTAPSWRLFQLAFVVMNLPSAADPEHEHRDAVELIFFPTGGGKTEAYLGVIAFTLVWRRIVGADRPDKGLGVAVLLRYTLRLLTLDQLGRAATLICALEILRRQGAEGTQSATLGDVRFSLGLWVGKSATANRLTEVARQISDYRNGVTRLSPFPLQACPWCRKELEGKDMAVKPTQKDPERVDVGCGDFRCAFSANKGGLPVLFVDEQIYRELPSFVVATVDKFAMLPWRGECGGLFGRVTHRIGHSFIGPCTTAPKSLKGTLSHLPEGLRPPDLIVQDELHLISGPLGTMVGLYETVVETLCTQPGPDGELLKPKIIASTATVKRASAQVRALFNREDTHMFPPAGIDDSESFFAQVDKAANKRLYVGVAAPGRSAKAILVTVYGALLAAAYKCIDRDAVARGDAKALQEQPADPYTTLVGYFNNLRELGGMRRLVEDLVHVRAANRGDLRPVGVETNPWMANRVLEKQPTELTSRESTSAISAAKEALGQPYGHKDFIPTVLASNMISVGIDIERLGLMVVAGQPMSTSEYIQATSRVGRDDDRPGLVVTCYNVNKPRDRSYYEHFRSYHESFYRRVESTSVTPFSGPALDRGLAGVIVAMVRHGAAAMGPPLGFMELEAHKNIAMRAAEVLVSRAMDQDRGDIGEDENEDEESVEADLRDRIQALLDTWTQFVAEAKEGGAQRCYSPWDIHKQGKPALQTAIVALARREKQVSDDEHFDAPTSMRDVEPTVHLWLRPAGGKTGGG